MNLHSTGKIEPGYKFRRNGALAIEQPKYALPNVSTNFPS